MHRSIKNINLTHSDPEAIYVDAHPTQVEDYLRLKGWLRGIQESMDISWAILGEVYGRYTQNGLDMLKIRLRRVRSSLNEKSIKFDFLPQKIGFKVAEAEMLSLLLQPLYGDHPGYGVRELLQNAFDAVREAKSLDLHSSFSRDHDVTVIFKVIDDKAYFTIKDDGIGMSAEVITEYFLNAGASFRSSKEWRHNFIDENNQSKVIRNGRFGVGALSAFMIGDSLTVDTRSSTETPSTSYSFTSGLYDESINVKIGSHGAGTKIEIAVDGYHVERLKEYMLNMERLFYFDDVKVKVEIDLNGATHSFSLDRTPTRFDIHTKTRNYEDIKIASDREDFERVADFVNGIAISPLEEHGRSNRIGILQRLIDPPYCVDNNYGTHRYKEKSIHVVDRNSSAPLNLARNQFTRQDQEIVDSLASFAFDELKSKLPKFAEYGTHLRYTGYFYDYSTSVFVFNKRGMMPLDIHLLNDFNIKELICLSRGQRITKEMIEAFPNYGFINGSGITSDMAPTNFIYSLRQIRQSLGAVKFASLMTTEQMVSVCSLATAPSWLKEILSILIEQQDAFNLLTIGVFEEGDLELLVLLRTIGALDSFTYLACDEWRHRAPNWPGEKEPQIGEMAALWRKTFSSSEGFYR